MPTEEVGYNADMNFSDCWTNGECIEANVSASAFLSFVFSKRGWVYIARNTTSSSGALKIGRTSKSPFKRMSTLVTSGVEGSYELLHAVAFVHSHWAEQAIHCALEEYRREKEFFGVATADAYAHLLATQRKEMVVLNQWPRSALLHAPTIQQFLQTHHAHCPSP